MDFGEILKFKERQAQQIQMLNNQNATMVTDFTNPMVFDTNEIRRA